MGVSVTPNYDECAPRFKSKYNQTIIYSDFAFCQMSAACIHSFLHFLAFHFLGVLFFPPFSRPLSPTASTWICFFNFRSVSSHNPQKDYNFQVFDIVRLLTRILSVSKSIRLQMIDHPRTSWARSHSHSLQSNVELLYYVRRMKVEMGYELGRENRRNCVGSSKIFQANKQKLLETYFVTFETIISN